MNVNLKPHQICETAVRLFVERGYDAVSMAEVAQRAGLNESDIYTYFGSKQDIVLFLYQCINADWQLYVGGISEKKLADRFELALNRKMELMQPYSDFLGDMMGLLLRHAKIGINSARTSYIRAMGLHAMQQVIDGSDDCKLLKNKIPQLPSFLYMVHWAVLFLSIQTPDAEKIRGSVRLVSKMLKQANNFSLVLSLFPFLSEAGEWADKMLNDAAADSVKSVDREILKIIFNSRKTTDANSDCMENKCETCMRMHEGKISYFTQQQKPVHFILPAFPAKSPNLTKVLGALPDLGEEIALMTLEDICKEIRNVYEPGAQVTICSDGRIFSELVGVTDEQVTNYVHGVKGLIAKLKLQYVSIVNLEDLMAGSSFDELRNKVLATYAEPLEELTSRLKSNAEFKSLFNGIHRFITDDRKVIEPDKSLSRIKKESGEIALRVIQHSNAWTRFLSYIYPDSFRLSVHPYPAHSDKTGIQLTKAKDNWITPWHGVIVLQEDGYVLMKKYEAEALGARLVMVEGQPYYYSLIKG